MNADNPWVNPSTLERNHPLRRAKLRNVYGQRRHHVGKPGPWESVAGLKVGNATFNGLRTMQREIYDWRVASKLVGNIGRITSDA